MFKFRYGWIILFVLLMGAFSISFAFADAPTGTTPTDAMMVPDNWQTLAANTSAWFYFDYTGSRSRIEALLDTNGVANVQFAIYTPDQANAWLQDRSTKPVGLGTLPGANTELAGHDAVWVGAFNSTGRFFALVANQNPAPVLFRLKISGTNVLLRPTPTRTPEVSFPNPYATPIPVSSIQGRLLFQEMHGGKIYTVNGDGSNLKNISYGMDPSWSPDGKQIAFARMNEPAGLFSAQADGSHERLLFGWPQIHSARWSPDGKRLAFARQPSVSEIKVICFFVIYCFPFPNQAPLKIGVIELDRAVGETTKHVLTEPPCSLYCAAPTWSPDNRTLMYADEWSGIMSTDTLTNTQALLFKQPARIQATTLSPNGTKIAFQLLQHDHWEIKVIDADGSNVRAVTRADFLDFALVNNVAPAWSPDSKQILFLSDRGGRWEFFVADADGANLRQVLKNVTDHVRIQYDFRNERVIDWTR